MIRKSVVSVLARLFTYVLLGFFLIGASVALAERQPSRTAALADSRVGLYFEENQGQTSRDVRFLARAGGYTAYLTGNETVLQYHKGTPGKDRGAVVRMRLTGGAQTATIRGDKQLPGIVNYLIGNDRSKWHTRIPTYAEVQYDKVYPGVDLVYRPAGKQLEFDFHVAPGANAKPIRLSFSGASKTHVDRAGDLVLNTEIGPVNILKPIAYQTVDSKRVPVDADYELLADGEVGFRLGAYDHARELVIDPVLGPSTYYSTYLGSGFGDSFTSIAVNAADEAFITGYTYATNYPTGAETGHSPYESSVPTNYADNTTYSPATGFVTALNATGTGIIYSTYISGDSADSSIGVQLNGIAVNGDGFAFVGGQTDDPKFPKANPFQGTYPPSRTMYVNATGVVFELTQHGDDLVYSTFLGGGDYDTISAIAVDGANNAYVVGTNTVQGNSNTQSAFPVTPGAIWQRFTQQNIGAGFIDAFVAKIAPPNGGNAQLVYSTVIGSVNAIVPITYGKGIAVDASGSAYVTGTTNGEIGDHGGAIAKQLIMGNVTWALGEYVSNVWVLKLDATGATAPYLSYVGGSTPGGMFSPNTQVTGIQVDNTGKAFLAGTTQANNFLTTANAYQRSSKFAGVTSPTTGSPQSDGFVTVIAANGGSFDYSTYLNGTTVSPAANAAYRDGSLTMGGIAVVPGGSSFAVSGVTSTTDFPVVGSPAGTPLMSGYPGCPSSCGSGAAFITKFDSNYALSYSTFLGSGNEKKVDGVGANGPNVYVMFGEPATGLSTGGAYDSDNTSGKKELVVRVWDAPALSTSVVVDGKTTDSLSSKQTISLTSSVTSPTSSVVDGGVVTYTVTGSGSTQIGTPVTSGIVSGSVAPPTDFELPANTPYGTYTILANYVGAAGFLSSSQTGILTVQSPRKDTNIVLVTPSTSVFAQSIVLSATVISVADGNVPTGTVTFFADGNRLGDVALNDAGQAALSISTLSVGARTITATYNGDQNFNGSASSSVVDMVSMASTTTTLGGLPSSSQYGSPVTLTATVLPVSPSTGTVTGAVTFSIDGVEFGSAELNGSGFTVITVPFRLSVGNHAISAMYTGASGFGQSTSSVFEYTITQASTVTTLTAGPAMYGLPVSLSATVTTTDQGIGAPTGIVTFVEGGTTLGSAPLSAGIATYSLILSAGVHTITASYSGDPNFSPSTGTLGQTVSKANTAIIVTGSPNPSAFGQTVTFTANLPGMPPPSAQPTGTVSFLDGSTPIGTAPITSGVATFSTGVLTAGIHAIQVMYSGDANFQASGTTKEQTVIPASPVLTWNTPAEISYGTALSASQLSASASVPGTFTYNPPAGAILPAGTQTLTVTFVPTDLNDYVQAAASVRLKVAPSATVVGSVSPQTWIPITFAAGGTLHSVDVLTQGSPNLDFQKILEGSCTLGTNFNPGDTCAAIVTFSPKYAGPRAGAVVLRDATGNALATAYLSGIGQGPQVVFGAGAQSDIANIPGGPVGVALDGNGNVYVSGLTDGITKSAWTGNGYGAPVPIDSGVSLSFGVAVDGGGNLYISDAANKEAVKLPWTGSGYGPKIILQDNLESPSGIAVDGAGNVYVADANTNRVLKLPWSGVGYAPSIQVGSGLTRPFGVAVDASGNLYIADLEANRVLKLPWNGTDYDPQTLVGSGWASPYGVAVDAAGSLYVTNHQIGNLVKVPWNGTGYESPTELLAGLAGPTAVAVDGSGNIYVAEAFQDHVLKLNRADMPSLTFGSVQVGTTGTEQNLALENIGNTILNIGQISADVNFGLGADATCAGGQGVGPGSSCLLAITFAPTEVGNNGGNLLGRVVISDNTLNQTDATQTISLTGTAIQGNSVTTITASPTTQVYGGNVTFTAAVMPNTATGTVTFYDNGAGLGAAQPLNGGQATLTTATLPTGTHSISATYSGDANYHGSNATTGETITQATPVITWATPANITYGTPLSGTQLNAGTTTDGTWTYNPPAGTILAVGTHTLSTTFLPSDTANYATMDASVTLTVDKAVASVTPNAVSKTYGTTDPALSGTLTGFVPSDNVSAIYTRTSGETVAGGPYTISAKLTPTDVLGNYEVNYGTAAFTITKAEAVTALETSSPAVMVKNSVTLKAKVTSANGSPTGRVSFMDAATELGTVTLDDSGTATLTISTLATGSHSLTAIYQGDSNFNGVTSAATNETVQDFQVGTASGGTISAAVASGAIATYQLQVTPLGGTTFPEEVTLTLSGLPVGATYSISPAKITAGGAAQAVTIQVQTAKTMAGLRTGSAGVQLFALGLLFPMLGIVHLRTGKLRKKYVALMIGLLLVVGLMGMSACGGGSSSPTYSPKTYNLQLTATSGGLQHTTSLSLTIK